MSNWRWRSHAEHNESVCHLLCNQLNNVDWVITTAFYAALHFTECKLFPMNYRDSKGQKFKLRSFSEYYGIIYPYGMKNRPNKHDARVTLVSSNISRVGADYKWLKDTCYTARYINYKFTNEQQYIDGAKRRLANIKAACV